MPNTSHVDTTITYETESGERAEMIFTETVKKTTALTSASIQHQWLPKREEFCRNVAAGMSPVEAYTAAYQCQEPITCSSGANRLMADTDVLLRIHQLKQPVIRKLAKKIEYTLNKALEDCQTARDLAYVKGDARTILKSVELASRLTKILGADELNINHRFGLLDDASTDVLLAMRKQVEDRRAKEKRLSGPTVDAEVIE